jgi:hypothetical protein
MKNHTAKFATFDYETDKTKDLSPELIIRNSIAR